MTEYHSFGFGETLRRRREQLGFSLNDVAVRTRVRKAYLQALEEENLAALPGAAYAIGFLRIYARHLDLKPEPLVAALTGKPDAVSTPLGGEGTVAVQRDKARSGNRLRLLLLILLLIAVGAGYFFYPQSHPVVPPPGKPVARPADSQVQPAPSPVVPPQAPVPVPVATAAPPAVEVVPLAVLPPGGGIVRLVAAGAGMVKVTLDGQDSRDYELHPEEKLNWKVGSQLQLEFSAPALVRCWVNDQEIPLAEQVAVRLVKTSPGNAPRQ